MSQSDSDSSMPAGIEGDAASSFAAAAAAAASDTDNMSVTVTSPGAPHIGAGRAGSVSTSCGDTCDPAGCCFLCKQPIADEAETMWHGWRFHGKCYNALRCHRRIVKDSKADDKLMALEPERWRTLVQPLIAGPGGRCAAERRKAKMREIEEEFNTQSSIRDKLKLTKTRHRAFMKFWEGCGSDTADELFDEKHEADEQEDTDGEPVVFVKDNARERSSSGATRRTQVAKKKFPDPGRTKIEEQPVVKRLRLSTKSRPEAAATKVGDNRRTEHQVKTAKQQVKKEPMDSADDGERDGKGKSAKGRGVTPKEEKQCSPFLAQMKEKIIEANV